MHTSPRFVILVLVLCAISCRAFGQELPVPTQGGQAAAAPQTLDQKASYLIGYNFVQDLRSQGVAVDLQQLIAGIQQAGKGERPTMSDEEIISVMTAFERKVAQQQQEMWEKAALENKQQGRKFLEENAAKEGVKVLENGIQLMVLNPGSEAAAPVVTDTVRFHYQGSMLDGTVFESSLAAGQPATSKVGSVDIRGLAIVLQQMTPGAKWKVFIPSDLAYGINGKQMIGPNEVLIFEIELLEVVR